MLREYSFDEPRYLRIVHGLLALRKLGLLFAVYCDAGEIRVQHSMWGDRERLSWCDAEGLIEMAGLKKGPQSESVIITDKSRSA